MASYSDTSPALEQRAQRQRRNLRRARISLSAEQRKQAALRACRNIARHRWLHAARHVVIYLPVGSEISPLPLLDQQTCHNKRIYLPVITGQQLRFAPLDDAQRWRANRFGIMEPIAARRRMLRPVQLDLVITPLLGFDGQGNRLGAGGGFYDRSFAFRQLHRWGRPRLLGLAFECQRCDALPIRPWDVALDAVATEAGIQRFIQP